MTASGIITRGTSYKKFKTNSTPHTCLGVATCLWNEALVSVKQSSNHGLSRGAVEKRSEVVQRYKQCLHVVRAGTLGWMPWMYRTYPDLVSLPPIQTAKKEAKKILQHIDNLECMKKTRLFSCKNLVMFVQHLKSLTC